MALIDDILDLMDEGLGLRRVAEELGVTYGKVRWEVQKHNNNAVHSAPTAQQQRTNSALTPQPFVTYVWDLETTDLNSFFGRLIVASFFNLNTGEMQTRTIYDFDGADQMEREIQLIEWVVDRIEEADILIGHNTLAFDCSFLRGRLAAHGEHRPLPKRIHYDTFQMAKFAFKGRPQGYSLENLLDFFHLPVQKDKPSKYEWADSVILDEVAVARIAQRCESDVIGNALVWDVLRPYYNAWKGR